MVTSVMRRQPVMALLTLFAGIALLLAAEGIYGVISYRVTSDRTRLAFESPSGRTGGTC